MSVAEIRQRLERLCHNDSDFFTQIPWSIAELEAVVTILNDDIVKIMDPEGPRHCFLLQGLFQHVTRSVLPQNPYTDVRIPIELKRKIFFLYLHYLENKQHHQLTAEETRDFGLLRKFASFLRLQNALKQSYQNQFFDILRNSSRLSEAGLSRRINDLRRTARQTETDLMSGPRYLGMLRALKYYERVL